MRSEIAILTPPRRHLSPLQYWFTRFANGAFTIMLLCFPVLLIATPSYQGMETDGWDSVGWRATKLHLQIFVAFVSTIVLMVGANVLEIPWRHVPLASKLWFIALLVDGTAVMAIGFLVVFGAPELAFRPRKVLNPLWTPRSSRTSVH